MEPSPEGPSTSLATSRLRYRPLMTHRTLASATILAVGTELTTGGTRDTNSGDLARDLTDCGVSIDRLVALPDDLGAVTAAITDGLARTDLVVADRRAGTDPRRPDTGGHRRRLRRDARRRSRPGGMAGRALRSTGRAHAGHQPQAGLVDPQRHVDRQRTRHGARLVGRAAGRAPRGGPARTTVGDAADVAGRRPAAPPRAGRRARSGLGHAAPQRHRRVGAGRPHRRGPPATGQPADGDLRARRRRRPAHQRGRRWRQSRAADLVAQAEAEVAPLAGARTPSRAATRHGSMPCRCASPGAAWPWSRSAPPDSWPPCSARPTGSRSARRWRRGRRLRRRTRAWKPTHHACAPWPGPRSALAVRARERRGDTSVTIATDIDGRVRAGHAHGLPGRRAGSTSGRAGGGLRALASSRRHRRQVGRLGRVAQRVS